MKKSHVALLMAAVLVLSLSLPALGAPSLTGLGKRVTKLSKKVNRISRSHARENTIVRKILVQADANGSAEGSAPCPGSYEVAGGGAEWNADVPSSFDRITSSIPDGDAWFVAADSTRPAGAILEIYVVCARVGT